MFFLNISLAYIAALCFLSLSGYSLAFEITDDDMHAYRVNKKLNGRLKYTGYFIAPDKETSVAIIKRDIKSRTEGIYGLYRIGDYIVGNRPDVGVELAIINSGSITVNLVHNIDMPTEESRAVNIKYADNINNINKYNDINKQYFIHAVETDIYVFTSAFLRNKAIIFAPSVDIDQSVSVPFGAFFSIEDVYNWSNKYLKDLGYQVLNRGSNILVVRHEKSPDSLENNNTEPLNDELCKKYKNKSGYTVQTKKTKLIPLLGTLSRHVFNKNLTSWPNSIENTKITIQENLDVNGCELLIHALNENELRIRIDDDEIKVITADRRN